MKHCLKAVFFLLLVLESISVWAQGENANWMFGHNARLNFSTSPPSFSESNMECWEGGSVSFSDAAGNLLFYSNGNKVWNASGNVMPHGDGILGNGPTATPPYGYLGSSAQGTAAIQSLAAPSLYYLFVLDAMEDGPPYSLGRLRYSVIDMSLNGGTGDVVPAQKNILLADSMTEKMTVIKADGCGFWLITHKMYTNYYSAFKIDAMGLHTEEVISTGVVPGELGYGMLHAAPDGKTLVMTAAGPSVELCSFNNITGMVSDAASFSSLGGKIGTCISPDNSKLYIGHYNRLSQYDLTLFPNVAAVVASEEVISTSVTFGQMRRGPDGKIYIANINTNNIAIIENPNNAGIACNYELYGMSRPVYTQFPAIPPPPSANQYGSGLGQEVMPSVNMLHTIIRSVKDTIICADKSLTLSVPAGFSRYIWSTADTTNTISIDQPGEYWVKSFINCDVYIDTFYATAIGHNYWNLGEDTAICPGDEIDIDAANPEINQYTWQDGSNTAAYHVTAAGTYSAVVNIRGCELTDSVTVSLLNPFVHIQEQDTAICRGTEISFHALAFPESSFLWNNGITGPQLQTREPGTYTVYADNVCGVYMDSVHLNNTTCDCIVLVPNAFSPNGDGRNDAYKVMMDCSKLISFELRIFNRFGQVVFQSDNSNQGWDGNFKGAPADMGTYFYYLGYKASDKESIERKGSIDLIR